MTRTDIRNAVVEALRSVAPEADPASMDEAAPLREALDLDSMDFLNFVIGIHKALRIDIPEADYAKLATLKSAIGYLQGKLEIR
jgi:acyl carrier protein